MTEKQMFDLLVAEGLSEYGAAALLGHFQAESGLNPRNLQNSYEKKLGFTDDTYTAAVDSGSYTGFVRDCAGYGLAQWTHRARKKGLLEFAQAAGKSVGDAAMQLKFALYELKGNYKDVFNALKTAVDIRAASDIVLTKYEMPADQSESVKQKRAGYGRELTGVSKDELPNVWKELSAGGYLLIPLLLFILIITVFKKSIIMGALAAIVLAIALSWIAPLFIKAESVKAGRVDLKKAGNALSAGSIGSMDAVAACGTAGIVVGVMSLTGLAQRLGSAVMELTRGNLPLTLVAVMVFCLVLGMGMPTVPAYILAASVGTPTLIKMGVDPFVSHMFCMYFATISTITPPVALAGYAAAGIAGASPSKTSWEAMKLGLSAYIVPFVFVYNQELLWIGSLPEIGRAHV